jgi:hypothetical protein
MEEGEGIGREAIFKGSENEPVMNNSIFFLIVLIYITFKLGLARFDKAPVSFI